MKHSRFREWAVVAAKAAVSAGLIALILRGIDSRAVLEHLQSADRACVAASILVTTSIALLHARRWEVVLGRLEHGVPFGEAFKLVLIGYFFNQTLPSTVGGDAYRVWGAYKLGIHAGTALLSVVVDRVLALMSLVLMICAGAWWLFEIVQAPLARWAIALLIAGCVTGSALLLLLARFAATVERWRPARLLVSVSKGALRVLSSARAGLQVLGLTLLGYVAISFAVFVLAKGLDVDLGMGHALLFVPLVTLIAVLPVSIAGWGLRESSMVVALGLIGVPSTQALSLSVLFGLVVMASGVPGGILWLLRRGRRPAAAGIRDGEVRP
jgi:uncharacterized protein (TIRG00374 family)